MVMELGHGMTKFHKPAPISIKVLHDLHEYSSFPESRRDGTRGYRHSVKTPVFSPAVCQALSVSPHASSELAECWYHNSSKSTAWHLPYL